MAAGWSLRAMAALPWDLNCSDSGVVEDTLGADLGVAPAPVVVLLLVPAPPVVSLPLSFS